MVQVISQALLSESGWGISKVEIACCAGVNLAENVGEDNKLASGLTPFNIYLLWFSKHPYHKR